MGFSLPEFPKLLLKRPWAFYEGLWSLEKIKMYAIKQKGEKK